MQHRIRTIDRETGFQTTTTADYAVEVHGNMPKDATEEELIAHFSDLYALDKPDFRNRPPFEAKHKNHCSVQSEGLVNPVQNISHITDGGSKYMGKWVAEVSLYRNDGNALMKYLKLSGIQEKIRHFRGVVKKHSEDTPYVKGADAKKVEKAEKS